jgi:hypothetical protein
MFLSSIFREVKFCFLHDRDRLKSSKGAGITEILLLLLLLLFNSTIWGHDYTGKQQHYFRIIE